MSLLERDDEDKGTTGNDVITQHDPGENSPLSLDSSRIPERQCPFVNVIYLCVFHAEARFDPSMFDI